MANPWQPPPSSRALDEPHEFLRHSYIASVVVGTVIGAFLAQRAYITTFQIDVVALAHALDPRILWVVGAAMVGLVLGQLIAFVLWSVVARFLLRLSRSRMQKALRPSWQEGKLDRVDRALLNFLYGKDGV